LLLKFASYITRQAIVTNDVFYVFIIIIIIIIIYKDVTEKLRPRVLIILLIQFHFTLLGSCTQPKDGLT